MPQLIIGLLVVGLVIYLIIFLIPIAIGCVLSALIGAPIVEHDAIARGSWLIRTKMEQILSESST